MKIERLKSILLIILVISSIVLTANKWYSKELWPEGYSFFSNVKNYFSGNKKNETSTFNPNEEVLNPAKIIINNLNNHILFTKSSENYNTICPEIKEILNICFKSKSSSVSDIKEWNDHLQSKSCYFSYPVMYDSSYFASQLSQKYSGKIDHFKEFIITNDQRLPSVMYVYIKDAKTDAIEKIKINYESTSINFLLDKSEITSNDINYYSFELNFDTNTDESVEEHVIIDHDVLINIAEKKANAINETNLFSNIASNINLYSNILPYFNYNTSNIRKYVESDNSIVFVENYGTLKLHSNGKLEYLSIDEGKGIDLNADSINDCLNSCITFANDITSLMNNDNSMYFEISSDIHDISSKTFTLTFDYYIYDNKIIIPNDLYTQKNAIEIKVVNGKIVSYNQIFVSFAPSQEFISCGSAIDAIDQLEKHTETVADIFIAYIYDNNNSRYLPLWNIEDSKGNITTISPKSEV